MKENTIAKQLSLATEKLNEAGIENARLDAEVLLAYVLNTRRLALYVHVAKVLTDEQITRFHNLIKRRLERVPVAYLTGHKEFMGLNFAVTPDVLIPRPDTEVLAQGVIEHLHEFNRENLKLADLGVGSGAICVSILKFVENVTADAVDISKKALEIAEFNAEKFNVDDRMDFYEGNLFEPLEGNIYDVIVSNPPYIAAAEFKNLQVEIETEPHVALHGGADGLKFYRKIIEAAPKFLADDGFLAMEIGFNQSESVQKLINDNGNFKYLQVWKDLAGIERVIAAWKK
ncbi:MAG: peptide chain release factor N(5)-glutamine methyltransferase [Selenomonadaceae bacterium]|nr:peptide chain release factor N(5)-glutamine methyltransferase [Selenomonadaceae bacterium]